MPAPRPARITVDSQSHDGRGVGRLNGKVAFVAGALPGETVEAVLAKSHRRYDEYRLSEVLVPAPERIEPRCPLVGRCGGCDLQHQRPQAQLEHKTRVVLDLLRRQGNLEPGALVEPLTSAPFGYRRRARLAVNVGRAGPVVGFREGSGRGVVAVDRCPVLAPPLEALPGRVQACLDGLSRPEAIGHVEIAVSETRDGAPRAVIHVHLARTLGAGDRDALAALGAAATAYLSIGVPDGRVEVLHRPSGDGPGYRLPEFELRIAYAPGDFLQGNAEVNRALVGRVVDWLGEPDGRRVLDAFAGAGNFSLALARRGFRVLAVEGDAGMVERARANARANGLDGVEFAVRNLMDAAPLSGIDGIDAAVLDPPRAGALSLVQALADQRIPRVLYVSCAPATFARDAAILGDSGYGLERLALVDMFPQTGHIELLAEFADGGRRGRRRRRDG